MAESLLLEDVLDVLIQLETLGHAHYATLSHMTPDLELQKLFRLLSEQELKHRQIYEGYKTEMIPFAQEEVTEEYRAYAEVLLKDAIRFLSEARGIGDFESGFAEAVQLEKDTLLFLTEMRGIVGPAFHEPIDRLMDQERRHLMFLLTWKTKRA